MVVLEVASHFIPLLHTPIVRRFRGVRQSQTRQSKVREHPRRRLAACGSSCCARSCRRPLLAACSAPVRCSGVRLVPRSPHVWYAPPSSLACPSLKILNRLLDGAQATPPLGVRRGFVTVANAAHESRKSPLYGAMTLCGAAVIAGVTGISAWDAARAEESPKPSEKVGPVVLVGNGALAC